MIDGVNLIPLKRIPDDRGTIMHMLKKTVPHWQKFGEIYFTTLYKDVIKAWHKHTKMDLNYACIKGLVKVVLYDDRSRSKTRGELNEFYIGDDNYALLQIPHGVINGMKGLISPVSIVANCATLPHDPAEMIRISPEEAVFDYDWTTQVR